MSSAVTAKTVARAIQEEVFGGGNLELIETLYFDPLVEKMKTLVTMLRTAFPDLSVSVNHLIAEGDKVACGWTARGTQKGWFFNIPPTNAEASWSGVSIYVIDPRDMRVCDMAGNWDLYGLMGQLRAALS